LNQLAQDLEAFADLPDDLLGPVDAINKEENKGHERPIQLLTIFGNDLLW
jgi:hypothetical protein